MQDFAQSFALAFGLVLSADPDLVEIVWLSVRVSLTAVLLSCLIGLPVGAVLAMARFPGRHVLIVVVNALMGLPPVVVGLIVYLLVSRSGPLGWLEILYTPAAMIFAQTLLVAPIVAALSREVLSQLHEEYDEQFRSWCLPAHVAASALLWDARFSLMTVALAGFGRALAEVGAVIIVGGNINHLTRVMTSAIALETSKGDLALALALGVVLMALALAINAGVMGLRLGGAHVSRS